MRIAFTPHLLHKFTSLSNSRLMADSKVQSLPRKCSHQRLGVFTTQQVNDRAAFFQSKALGNI